MPIVRNKSGLEKVFVDNFEEISVNVDGLETLQTAGNASLTSIDTRLDECIGHTNNTTSIGDGSNQLRSVMLGYDRANGKARSLLVDSGGKLECSVSDLEVTMENVNLNTDTLEAKLQSIDTRLDNSIGAVNNSDDLGDGSSQFRSMAMGYDRSGGKARSMLVDAGGSLETNSVLKGFQQGTTTEKTLLTDSSGFLVVGVGGYPDLSDISSHTLAKIDSEGHFQVDIVSAALATGSATAALQSTGHGHHVTAHGKLDHLSDNLDTLETSLTAIESKMDVDNVVFDNQLTKLNAIDEDTGNILTKLNEIDSVLDTSKVVHDNILTKNTEIDSVLDAIDQKLGDIETAVQGTLTVGSHAVTNAGTFAVQAACSGTVTANLSAVDNAVLDDVAQKLGDIETAVQGTLTVGSHAVTNAGTFAVQAACSGTVTANLSAVDNAVLDAIETTNNAIQAAVEGTLTVGSHAVTNAGTFATQAVCSGTVTANLGSTDNAVLDDIAQKLGDIETGVQLLDNAISGNEMQVDVISMPTTTVTGTVIANLSATDNAVLDDIATDLAALEVLQTATNSKIDTLDSVLDASLVKQTSMTTDLAALEVLNTSILAKIQPTRDVVTIFNNTSLGADATITSAEVDMLNFRHIRIVGFSDEDDKSGQIQIWGATSSGGTYFDMGFSSASYSSSAILVPTIENIPVRYIKLVITDQTGSSSNIILYGFRLN